MAARLREFASGTDAGKQQLIRAAEAEELHVEECEKAIATPTRRVAEEALKLIEFAKRAQLYQCLDRF
jgi:pyrroloquinoline quinone (PQQ) biosynthesis protein C